MSNQRVHQSGRGRRLASGWHGQASRGRFIKRAAALQLMRDRWTGAFSIVVSIADRGGFLKASRVVSVLSALTGGGILLQWALVWSGVFPVAESTPGFRHYFLSFAVADMWLVCAAFLTVLLVLKADRRATLASVALGSAMFFFGLYALLYDFNTGLLFRMSADELLGKGVTLYNIVVGLVLMVLAWRGSSPLRAA